MVLPQRGDDLPLNIMLVELVELRSPAISLGVA
jgi:hypothetical protein